MSTLEGGGREGGVLMQPRRYRKYSFSRTHFLKFAAKQKRRADKTSAQRYNVSPKLKKHGGAKARKTIGTKRRQNMAGP